MSDFPHATRLQTTTVDIQTWMLALRIGEESGCRPSWDVSQAMDRVRRYDKVLEDDREWSFYLWTMLTHLDERYASCLAESLSTSIERLRSLDLEVETGDASLRQLGPFGLTRRQLLSVDCAELNRLAEWLNGGSFDVAPPGPGVGSTVRLSRMRK